MMVGECTSMCPLSELHGGINERPSVFEQWSSINKCPHAQKTDEMLATPSSTKHTLREKAQLQSSSSLSSSLSSSNRSPLSEFLSPVSAYRRSASASASSGTSTSRAQEQQTLRTLDALRTSMQHLLQCVLPRLGAGNSFTFVEKYQYMNDRMRQIKKEITMQFNGNTDTAASSPTSSSIASSSPLPLSTSLSLISIYECMVRFYILAQYMLFGEQPPQFDSSLNDDRIEDCLHALLQLYPTVIQEINSAEASTVSTQLFADLTVQYDRFRSYSLLLHLNQNPWSELQQMLGSPAKSADNSLPNSNAEDTKLPFHLARALRILTAFHTPNAFAFFHEIKQASTKEEENQTNGQFDPMILMILQRHILPFQLSSLKRLVFAGTPNGWFPLWKVHELLGTPSVPDAALLCKSLLTLPIRRPPTWDSMDLPTQETDAAVANANLEALEGGSPSWGVQIGSKFATTTLSEAAPVVFKAYYDRELKRRLKRFQAQELADAASSITAAREVSNPVPDSWDQEDEKSATESESIPSSSSSTTSRSSLMLWKFLPQTILPRETIAQIVGSVSHVI